MHKKIMITSEVRLTGILALHVSKREMREQQHSLIAEFELAGKIKTYW